MTTKAELEAARLEVAQLGLKEADALRALQAAVDALGWAMAAHGAAQLKVQILEMRIAQGREPSPAGEENTDG